MRNLDIPPVWLIGTLVLVWLQSRYLTFGLSLDSPVTDLIGGVLVGGGLVLIALAAYEMFRHKTTIHPHGEPAKLITTGIFSRSRNPIYLADLLILGGFILYWDAILSLPLIPIFLWVIEKRFVVLEEKRLRTAFRADFARYCQKTRRWM